MLLVTSYILLNVLIYPPPQMCPKETRDGPGSAERSSAAAVVAPMRFDARPTFRPTCPPSEPVGCVPAYL